MSALLEEGATGAALDQLAPYARHSVRRAAGFALRLHAEEVTPEHLLGALFEDEDCAATRVILHAFADPETLSIELFALSPGILVVGSKRALPFSTNGVRVLDEARAVAGEDGEERITPAHLVRAARRHLDPAQRERLAELGFAAEAAALPADASAADDDEPLLRRLTPDARRALSSACSQAHRLGRASISPAHVLMGALEQVGSDAPADAPSARRVALALTGCDADDSPPPARRLPASEGLVTLLAALPVGADTCALLAHQVRQGSEEVRALLARQKITPQLLEHAAGAFEDPELPA